MPTIYHITTASAWESAQQKGCYVAESLRDEGFIHCSQAEQVDGVLTRYFAGKTDLVMLIIDTEKLTSRFIYEWSPSTTDTFPHIFGSINLESVTAVEQIAIYPSK